MRQLSASPDKSIRVIDAYISRRLAVLKGGNRDAFVLEYKEWLSPEANYGDEIWTIPDLTDEGLCDFFRRAISDK